MRQNGPKLPVINYAGLTAVRGLLTTTIDNRTLEVPVNSTVTLNCRTSSQQPIRWHHEYSKFVHHSLFDGCAFGVSATSEHSVRVVAFGGGSLESELTIALVDEADSGIYRCFGANNSHIIFQLSVLSMNSYVIAFRHMHQHS